jgi:hypothetical protein
VRGGTGEGGLEVGGWPSASKNLRIRSASDSFDTRRIGGGALGVDGDDVRSAWLRFPLVAALVKSWNRNATAISKRKSRFSKWMAITFRIVRGWLRNVKRRLERVTRLELATSSLARRCSTTELHPQF